MWLSPILMRNKYIFSSIFELSEHKWANTSPVIAYDS